MRVEDFWMHGLHHSLESYMAINGTSSPVKGKALNHKSQVSTAIYARLSQQVLEDAVSNTINNIQKSAYSK